MNIKLPISTRDGEFVAHYSDCGLTALDFPKAGKTGANAETNIPVEVRRWHKLTSSALREMLEGRAPDELPPVDLRGGTEFQQRVWGVLRNIATGQTKSYAEVADAIGKPGAARAVGNACGSNPIPVLVPCHRVLAANRRIGGFSGGLDWKRKLLARERVEYMQLD